MTDRDPLVVFTPSGKRGRFPVGTPLLPAARTLGVDVDSVCGGRGICGRCQVLIAEGEFAKHGVRSGARERLAGLRDRDSATRSARGLPAGHRLSCSTQRAGRRRRRRAARQPGASPGRAQGCRRARDQAEPGRAAALRRGAASPTCRILPATCGGCCDALEREWQLTGLGCDLVGARRAAGGPAQGRVESHRRRARRLADHRACGRASTTRPSAWRSTSARPRSPRTCAISRPASSSPPPGIDEPADPLRRRPDEPRLVRDDEPGRRGADDRGDPRARSSELAAELAREAGIETADILELTLVGNPIMHHLVLGIDPVELGGAPFALAVDQALTLPRLGARYRRASRTRASTCCPASPATSAPTPPA